MIKLLAKALKCSENDISGIRGVSRHGMSLFDVKGVTYAVGGPKFTENFYGDEIVLNEALSAYRLSIENPT